MATDVKGRKWQITINNPQEKQLTRKEVVKRIRKLRSLQYYCLSEEIARSHHLHGYFLFKSPVRFSTLQNTFNGQAHIEKAYGTSIQNRDYVFKEGKWKHDKKNETNLPETHEEWGDIPEERQGARNDCVELYEMITEGKSNYEILEENPSFIKQIERIDRVRQIVQEERYREVFREVYVEYVYGQTGAGKTRDVMTRHSYANVFRVTSYRNPYDQYQNQDVIVYEEFDDSLPIVQMLLYLDGYPLMLPCRYSDKVACYTKVYILSNKDLCSQYQDIQRHSPETWKAFLRRINSVKVYKDGQIKQYTCEEYIKQKKYSDNPFE